VQSPNLAWNREKKFIFSCKIAVISGLMIETGHRNETIPIYIVACLDGFILHEGGNG
jgi:hypothetical protein